MNPFKTQSARTYSSLVLMTVMIVGGMSFLISCVDVVQAVTKTSSAVTPAPVPAAYTLGALPDNKSYSDFVVGPGKIELNLNPGDTRTVEITIANRLGTPRVFNVSEEDFTGSNDLNQPVVLLGDDRGPYSAKDVIHIPLSSVDIPHAEKAFIPVTVSIPANAQPGGLYGSVVVSVTSNPPSGTPPIGASTATNPVITRLAVLFFIRIAGPVSAEGQLSQFSLSGKKTILWNSDPVSFDMVYKNTGSIYLVPSGSISVTNMLGSPVAEIAVDPWFAMPASLRFREVTWAPPFLFGRYTAHAVINRGYASTSDQADLVFWVIPWKIILSVLIVLFIVIFGIRWIVTRFKFKIARK